MSKKNTPDLTKFYRRSPNVVSPWELDQKILREARRLAPERHSVFSNLRSKPLFRDWMPITVTVCMIGLAVVLVRPVMLDFKQPKPVESVKESVAVEKELESVSLFRFYQSLPEAIERKSLSVEKRTKTVLGSAEGELNALRAKQKKIELSVAVPSIDRIQRRHESRQVFARERALVPLMTSPEVADSLMQVEQMKVDQIWPDTLSAQVQTKTELVRTETELAQALEEIKRLIEQENFEAAKFRLEELQKRCPECEMPDSIDQF